MTASRQMEAMLRLLLGSSRPQHAARIDLSVTHNGKLFEVSPGRGTAIRVAVSAQIATRPDLMDIIEDCAAALDAVAYGTTMAKAIRLDADQRWAYEQRLLPCTD